jgi:hypothetical protein
MPVLYHDGHVFSPSDLDSDAPIRCALVGAGDFGSCLLVRVSASYILIIRSSTPSTGSRPPPARQQRVTPYWVELTLYTHKTH